MKKKILITGAGGYVGATLVAMLKDDYEVVGFGFGAKINADITDYKKLSRAAKGAYAIVHTASPTKNAWINEHPYEALRAIVIGSRNVRRAAEEHKIPLVIHFSTQAVYSNFAKRPRPLREDMELQPDNFYGALKALAEEELRDKGPRPYPKKERGRQETGDRTRIVILRPANIYGVGAGVLRRNVVSVFAENARNGKPLVLMNGGRQKADFVHVRDIAWLVALILKRQEISDRRQVVINAGSGTATSIKDIARIMVAEAKRSIGKSPKIISQKVPKETIAADRWLSIAKAWKGYGWKPKITLQGGIRELLS
ncbi:MAG: NAD(P)-dependent oxidoreductase [Parcubacteria group bacterium]|nr:NAD(P)-dependent oxidoreductase [Parcubacteria group bacterium]